MAAKKASKKKTSRGKSVGKSSSKKKNLKRKSASKGPTSKKTTTTIKSGDSSSIDGRDIKGMSTRFSALTEKTADLVKKTRKRRFKAALKEIKEAIAAENAKFDRLVSEMAESN